MWVTFRKVRSVGLTAGGVVQKTEKIVLKQSKGICEIGCSMQESGRAVTDDDIRYSRRGPEIK